jgi:hypothetical protein
MDALRLMREQVMRHAARGAGRSFASPLFTEAQGASVGAEPAIHALPLDFTDMEEIEAADGTITLMLDFDGLDTAPLG